MSYVNLTVPSKVNDLTGSWTKRMSVLLDDGYSTYNSAYALGSPLIVKGWEDSLPADAVISGIIVSVKAYSTVVNDQIYVGLTHDSETTWGSLTSTVLSTSAATYTLGASGDNWGTGGLTLSSIKQNQDFGIKVLAKSGSGQINIDYVYLTVYYTSNSDAYLRGNRSNFPRAIDDITLAQNGTGGRNAIRTGDVDGTPPSPSVNLLGDCLYNIEKTLVQQTDLVRSIGAVDAGNLYFYTITVTGTVSGNVSYGEKNGISWEAMLNKVNGVIKSGATFQSSNLNNYLTGASTVRRTTQCMPAANINFNFVSAIGWINNGGTAAHLCVSPKAFLAFSDDSGSAYGYYIGFSAMSFDAPNITPLTNDGYKSVNVGFAAVPNGTFVVKMLAIGGDM